MAKTEAKSEQMDEEMTAICAELAEAKPGTDFAALNKRLAVLQQESKITEKKWEEAAAALEEVLQRQEQKLGEL